MDRTLVLSGNRAAFPICATRIRFAHQLLAALFAFVHGGLKAEEPNPPQPAAVKTDQAVNVMWRFDGCGRFPAIHPPRQWSADQNILWRTPVDAGGFSSPIAVKGKVFVTAEMGSLICLDAADGKLLWQRDLFSQDSKEIPAELSRTLMRGCGGESKQSTPTPASNGELVFYINAMGLSACYDFAGKQKWIRLLETAENEEQFTSSPIFLGDKIILSWGCLLALDAKDGKTLWKAADVKAGYGTPAIAKIGGEAVALTPGGAIVRAADGTVLCSGQFESAYATPLVEGGVVYIIDATARALELPARAEPGMRLKELWKTELSGTFMASPVYSDGLIYTIENQKCRLHIIDARTGQVLTSTHSLDAAAKSEKPETGLKIEGMAPAKYAYGSPAAADGNVFFFDDAGHTAVLGLGRQYKLLRVNKIEDAILGTPFFFEDRIIIRGAKTVYCIGGKP